MPTVERADVVVVGGGIVGLATARAIQRARPEVMVLVLEKESGPAVHQSGRNSGVIHSGVYYRPGSLKAATVAAGRTAMVEFCQANGVAHQVIGKVIVAVEEREMAGLRELEQRALGNGVPAELIGTGRLAELEPHAAGVGALHVPGAAIVDFRQVCLALARLVADAGGEFRSHSRVIELIEHDRSVLVRTEQGDIEAVTAVNCAGLHSDLLAGRAPASGRPALRIVPFRGEYRSLRAERSHLVRTMIYPVSDPRFPFLGVHFTRAIGGEVHAGPNAVLALAREGYSWRTVDLSDTLELLRFPGFRRLAAHHWSTGLGEIYRSVSERAFLRALQRLVPDVEADDLAPTPAGVRAQAVDANGALVDDFVVEESPRVVHVLNAPSPAATASLEIGRLVAARTLQHLR